MCKLIGLLVVRAIYRWLGCQEYAIDCLDMQAVKEDIVFGGMFVLPVTFINRAYVRILAYACMVATETNMQGAWLIEGYRDCLLCRSRTFM